jgi:hypothetical protein
MLTPTSDAAASLEAAVVQYRDDGDVPALLERLQELAGRATTDELIAAVAPYRTVPEIAGPLFERIVADRPYDAPALVGLANAYWLTGRGGDVVGDLASRAIAADPTNRGGWHLWALSEANPRRRTERWEQIVRRFPDDELARATLADNAASLAGAEHDPVALALAIEQYAELLRRATRADQRAALETALRTLRGWKL